MKKISLLAVLICIFASCKNKTADSGATSDKPVSEANDSNTPLHLVQPDYPTPYGIPSDSMVESTLQRIHGYLDKVTPFAFVNSETGETLTDLDHMDEHTTLQKGDFRIVSYEWGVTYGAMQNASKITGDPRYDQYATDRLKFLAESVPHFKKLVNNNELSWSAKGPLRGLLSPHALDDCGAMCTAMLKYKNAGSEIVFDSLTNIHIDYILNKEHRLADGQLARMRPQPNSVWLDDMYMALPALAQMGKSSGDTRYFDEACRQVKLFATKMFNKDKKLFMHGWIEAMDYHPQFHWARANGWAILTITEILDVLPANHADRPYLINLMKEHLTGLCQYQDGTGFWHQLIDRNDTYLETSATAIYTYCIAHAINEGWIDGLAFSPTALLGWNALSTQVNTEGQVEGTCVGTGMGLESAFYFYRPISKFAAHGYGPAILATAEVLRMLKSNKFEINDSSVQLLQSKS